MTNGNRVGTAAALLVFGVLGATTAQAAPNLEAGHYQIDPSHTYAHFKIDHMGLSTLRGRMDVRKGSLEIGSDPSDSSIEITFDPASVDTGNDARDKHLRDTDGFFNVDKYPAITFRSTRVTFDDDDADEAQVTGNLTLHGVTRRVTLDVDDIACRINPLDRSKYTCGFEAETEIRRSDFGMDAYSQMVGDKVELSFEIEADKPINGSSK